MNLKAAVKSFSYLPSIGNLDSDLRVALDTGIIYRFVSGAWEDTGSRISLVNAYPTYSFVGGINDKRRS